MAHDRTKDREIADWLAKEIAALQPGDRLPRVRDIMGRFGVGQRRVELALAPYVEAGQITARRGGGMRIADPSEASDRAEYEADVLILYRLSDSRLARNLMQEIEVRLRSRGLTMLHIGYDTETKPISLLDRMQRFRVCLLQLHFETLSLAFLAALHAHADHLVIDGVSVTGIEADGIGTNWREALTVAFFDLFHAGHRRIGFLTSSHPARQIAMARREYGLLCRTLTPARENLLIEVDRLPGEYTRAELSAAISGAAGRMDALIAWGVVEGYLLESALAEAGLVPGRDISVILLGSTDFPSEHRNMFDVIGNSNAAKLDLFENVILDRMRGRSRRVETHYLPIALIRHGSSRTDLD
jgi:DNA-binding LacI/PurR family transcriptional regulator